MKFTLLLGIWLAFAVASYAQIPTLGNIYQTSNIDSLKTTLPSKKGLERVLTLLSIEKSRLLWKIEGDTIYLQQLREQLTRYPTAQGHYQYFKAKQEDIKKNSEKAFSASKTAYEFYKIQRDTVGMVCALLNMGVVSISSTKNRPNEYLQEAMQLTQHTTNPELQILYCYSLVRFLGREAFSTKSSELTPQVQKTLEIIKRYPQYVAYAPYLFNLLALIYESKHEYEKVQQMNLAGIDIYKKYTGKAPVYSLINLGLSYENQQKYIEAEKIYYEAMKLARESKHFNMQMAICTGIHASLVGQKKYKEAAPWADSIYEYGDKFAQFNVETKLQEAMIAYEVEKKEAANKILQQEKKLIETRSQLYIGLAIVVLIALLGASFLVYRLRQNNAKLKNAYNEIFQHNQARDYFFGVIAHDLRRPLSSFQDIANLIKYYLNTQRYEELNKVSQSIDQMGQRIRILLDNLLSWALSQREEVPHYPEKIRLGEKIQAIIELYQPIASYQKVEIKAELDDNLFAHMDPNACDLIIRNLVDNSIKNSRSGGRIVIKAKRASQGDHITLSVEDNGKGMSEEKVAAVRETLQHPVLRADRPRGLGMIMIGRFLKSNRITAEINSALNLGTTFILNIPLL